MMTQKENPAGGPGIIKGIAEVVKLLREWEQCFTVTPTCQDLIVAALMALGVHR